MLKSKWIGKCSETDPNRSESTRRTMPNWVPFGKPFDTLSIELSASETASDTVKFVTTSYEETLFKRVMRSVQPSTSNRSILLAKTFHSGISCRACYYVLHLFILHRPCIIRPIPFTKESLGETFTVKSYMFKCKRERALILACLRGKLTLHKEVHTMYTKSRSSWFCRGISFQAVWPLFRTPAECWAKGNRNSFKI